MGAPVKEAEGALLEARGLTKYFGGVLALDRVDFHVGRAEVVGLVGDNGAGKSTLIKLLTGVYRPDAGEIWFEGRRVTLSSPREARRLGIETVYQDLALVESLSVARNFFLGAEPERTIAGIRFLDRREMRRATEKALAQIGITSLRNADEPVEVLSGGERQAVAIGRALHFGARLLILDEPTSALSVKETQKVLQAIEESRRRGLSVIFITHNLYHVYPIADRIVVLHHGRKLREFKRGQTTLTELAELVAGQSLPSWREGDTGSV